MTTYSNQARQKIIMEHYQTPTFKRPIANPKIKIKSTRCVDTLLLDYQYDRDTKKFTNITFEGQGCAIFLASADIVIGLVNNENQKTIKTVLRNYYGAISGATFDANILQTAAVFSYVKNHLNRFECAKMIFDGLQKMCDQAPL